MAVSSDIIRTWRGPRAVLRGLLSVGQREDRAIAFLMAGCFLIFVAQWPRLARLAHMEGTEFTRLVAYEFLGWMIFWPLAFYIIALVLYAVLRLARVTIESWQVRLALFWAVLAAAPAGLLYGLIRGFVGPGAGANLVGAIWGAAVLWFIVQGIREAGARHGG